MLIDRFLPAFEVNEVHEVEIDAPPEIVYAAIRQTDLRAIHAWISRSAHTASTSANFRLASVEAAAMTRAPISLPT